MDTITTAQASVPDAQAILARLSALEQATAEAQQRASSAEQRVAELEARLPKDKLSMVVFSGDLDKVLAGFVIASGAAAMGLEVTMFFTFWGLAAIRQRKDWGGKDIKELMLQVMTPGASTGLIPSKLGFLGAGSLMLRQMMKEKDVASLEDLIALARESGVRLVACTMSMDVMGVRQEELMPEVELGGVAMFVGEAQESKASLFI
ncbi:MAG: DsrE/DsrF/DrsH-like family protein [Candidatus Sericytochromatia bacterium]|nr:DsrE/DsrF/DrsH-like family protein [Candidatus Sericytochromatia bacterium]